MIVKVTYLVVEFHFGCSFYRSECRRKAGVDLPEVPAEPIQTRTRCEARTHARERERTHAHTHMHAGTYTRT